MSVRRGFPGDGEEAQRRIIMAEIPSALGNVTVINGYFPQGESRDHETKFPAKAKFYQDLQNYLTTELKRKPGAYHGRHEYQPDGSGYRYWRREP